MKGPNIGGLTGVLTIALCFLCLNHAQAQESITILNVDATCIYTDVYDLEIDLEMTGFSDYAISVAVNGSYIGDFDGSSGVLLLNEIPTSGAPTQEIEVCSVLFPETCASATYTDPTPACASCENYWVNISWECNPGGMYTFYLTPQAYNPQIGTTGNLTVSIDGTTFAFPYTLDETYTFEGIELGPGSSFHEVLWFFDESDCGLSYLFLAASDCSPLCSIEAVDISNLSAAGTGLVDFDVNASFDLPEDLQWFASVDVVLNGENMGFYSLEEFPVSLQGVSLNATSLNQLSLCIGGITDNCCSELAFASFMCSDSCQEDINNDGMIGTEDLLAVLAGFGTTCP